MAIEQAFVGAAVLNSTAEHCLTSNSLVVTEQTTPGVYQAFINTAALTTGDMVRIKIYGKVRQSSPLLLIQQVDIAHAQDEPAYVTPSLMLMHGWAMTIQKVGSGPDIVTEWSIRKVA